MAYNNVLAERIGGMIEAKTSGNFESKKMFGGVGYLVHGNMACGILGDQLIVRVGKDAYQAAFDRPGVTEFLNNGRPMTGWVMVDHAVLTDDDALADWISKGVEFVLTLPEK